MILSAFLLSPSSFALFIGEPLNVAENSGCVMAATQAASRLRMESRI